TPQPIIQTPSEDDAPDELPDGPGFQPSGSVLIQQIERVRAGQSQDDSNSQALMLLYRVSEALAKASNLKSYLDELLVLILDQIRADHAVFLRIDGQNPERRVLAARDRRGPKPDAPVALTVVRWVTQKNFAVMSEDVRSDFRFDAGQSVRQMPDEARAVACVP